MNDPIDLAPHRYESEQELWDLHYQALLKRGIDFNDLMLQWVRTQKETFRDPRSPIEFDELCNHGCVPQVLAVLLSLARHSPKLVTFWATIVGDPKSRNAFSVSLERAAAVLQHQFREFITTEDDERRREFQQIGRIPLSALVDELRLYASVAKLAERFKIDVETRSPMEFSRFLLTNYVVRATGKFHDRNVATLFGEVMGLEAYDETAQRMWRDRNYDRLATHHSKLGEIVHSMSVVISRQT
jgi:hypothetical protein